MGTRGAYGFRQGSKDILGYCHWDSYPSGLGKDILAYCRSRTPAQMAETASRIVLIGHDHVPTEQEIADHRDLLDTGVGNQSVTDPYCLLRGAQGSLEAYDVANHYLMVTAGDFLADGLFCEYAYIVNLDEGVLECYEGFSKDPMAAGRYAALHDHGEYYGVVLKATYPLSSLPDDASFLADLEPQEDED